MDAEPVAEAKSVTIDGADVQIRPMRPSEARGIHALWVASYKSISKINPYVFEKHHPGLVHALMEKHGVTIACSRNLDTTILGWACATPGVALHYAHVPYELRNLGIARMVVSGALREYPDRIYVTHRFVGKPNSFRFIHNPYLTGMVP